MTTRLSASDRASAVIEMILDDREVPRQLHRVARSLRREVADRPHIVIDRLRRLSAEVSYPLSPATLDLAKVVSLERYWNHYVSAEVKAYFPDSEGYQRFIERQANPDQRLLDDLKDEYPLIPAANSWVTSHAAVATRPGPALVRDLELEFGTDPPAVILMIPAARAQELGVTIRSPRATDAVRANQLQWRRTGLVSGIPEWIDRDIPRSAVASVGWRP